MGILLIRNLQLANYFLLLFDALFGKKNITSKFNIFFADLISHSIRLLWLKGAFLSFHIFYQTSWLTPKIFLKETFLKKHLKKI